MKNALSPQAARLSPRLAAVLSCVEKCGVLADIGTDHAYLPIEAVRAGLCERAIACDVSVGPLEFAARNIRAAGLCDETFCNEADDNSWQTYGLIETRLGDGLAPLAADKADCIVIAGMGGMKIIEILQAEKKRAKRAVGTTGAVSEANVSRATGGMCRRRRI
ncbi:MAG: class I SAM-dependent methyltransferase, partial [Defluviitaleaceae bacterium]|nr:class I SAM-dependent methyltransferase [Defluviitaleaceae bacterium]